METPPLHMGDGLSQNKSEKRYTAPIFSAFDEEEDEEVDDFSSGFNGDATDPPIEPTSTFEMEEMLMWVAQHQHLHTQADCDVSCTAMTGTDHLAASNAQAALRRDGDEEEGNKEFDPICIPPPDPLLSHSRWRSVLHNRYSDPHTLYDLKTVEFFERLRDVVVVHHTCSKAATVSSLHNAVYKVSAFLHSDALLLGLEYLIGGGLFFTHADSEKAKPLALPYRAIVSLQEVLLEVLIRHIWVRSIELSTKHVVRVNQLLLVALHGAEICRDESRPSFQSLLVFSCSFWICYLHRQSLRRNQNMKSLSEMINNTLLVSLFPFFLVKEGNAVPSFVTRKEGGGLLSFDQVETRVLSHLLARYITSKDEDLVSEATRDITYYVQHCITHCWERLLPNVRAAALVWLVKQKSKQSTQVGKPLPRYLDSLLACSPYSPREAFRVLRRDTIKSNGFAIVKLEKMLLRDLSGLEVSSGVRAISEAAEVSAVAITERVPQPVMKGNVHLKNGGEERSDCSPMYVDDADEDATLEKKILLELRALLNTSGEAHLQCLDRVHRLLPLHRYPSVFASWICTHYHGLCSPLVFHILYREWPRVTALHYSKVNNDNKRDSSDAEHRHCMYSQRRMLGALWLLFRHVNILDVTRAMFSLLPSLTDLARMRRHECPLAPPSIVASVLRCVVGHTPTPLVRLVMEQLVEERELAVLPLHPYVLHFLVRLLEKISSSCGPLLRTGELGKRRGGRLVCSNGAQEIKAEVCRLLQHHSQRMNVSPISLFRRVENKSGRHSDITRNSKQQQGDGGDEAANYSLIPWWWRSEEYNALWNKVQRLSLPMCSVNPVPLQRHGSPYTSTQEGSESVSGSLSSVGLHEQDGGEEKGEMVQPQRVALDRLHHIITDLDEDLRLMTLMASMQKKFLRLGVKRKDDVRRSEIISDFDA